MSFDIFKDDDQRAMIISGMAEISSQSCVKFVEHTTEKYWVKFVKKKG